MTVTKFQVITHYNLLMISLITVSYNAKTNAFSLRHRPEDVFSIGHIALQP